MASFERESKGIRTVILPPQLPPIYDETVTDALDYVIRHAKVLTISEVGREIGRADSTAYKKKDGEVALTAREFLMIAKLALHKGDSSLAELAIPEGFAIIPIQVPTGDESLQEEICDAMRDGGAIVANCVNGVSNRKAERAADDLVKDATKIQRTVKKSRR